MRRPLVRLFCIVLVMVLIQFDMQKELLSHATSGAFVLEQAGPRNPLWVNLFVDFVFSPFYLIVAIMPEVNWVRRWAQRSLTGRVVVVGVVGTAYLVTFAVAGYSVLFWINQNLNALAAFCVALPAVLFLCLYYDFRQFRKLLARDSVPDR